MQRLIGSALCLFLCGLHSAAFGTMEAPLESRIRLAVMESSQIVVGKIVETEPFLLSDMSRVSLLVVEQSLFGPVAALDTLRIGWNADIAIGGNGVTSASMGGGSYTQIDELQGALALWLLADQTEFRCTAGPFLLLAPNRNQFERLADIVELGQAKVDSSSFYSLRIAELEAERDSVEKRAAFVRCLRNAMAETK